jgi:UDP:flavonoid glycosyltransferase YjiC (YdhE family)
MRFLFTSAGGRGHSDPLLPTARAAHAAGHDVAFCCRPPMAETLEAAGFTTFTAGPPIAAPPTIAPLLPLDRAREARVLRDGFAGRGIAHQRARDLLALGEAWRPDVFVSDETDFGALVAAERLDIPYATVLVVAAGSFVTRELIAEPLNDLRAEHGLGRDPDVEMLTRYLVLAPGPPSFRDPGFPLPPTAHAIRPAALDLIADDGTNLPDPDGFPSTVYFTLGTVFNMESGDVFQRALAGLRDLPPEVHIVATVGPEIDPATFGAQPPNVRVARYIPQSELLPIARAVVSHGGSGTVLGSLAFGVPSVLLPMGADQPDNADRCRALGVACVLDPTSCTPDEVRDAVRTVLVESSYRDRARSLRDETRALPGAAYALALVERLAAERRPIPAPVESA